MEPLASSILWVLNLDRIPWNLSFQILMKIISTFAEWFNFRKSISTLYRFVGIFHQLMFYYQYLHYTICISGITHFVSKYHSKSLFNDHWKLFWFKKFHGTFSRVQWNFLNNIWTTPVAPWNSMELKQQNLKFHGISWNSIEFCPNPKFHGIPWNFFHTLRFHGIPWNSMELFISPKNVPWNSIEFHGTFSKFHGIPWNSTELDKFDIKKNILLNIVVGVWLMIRCNLAKISQKRYILHWFQYRNLYFEHPSVSENGARWAKMACCCMRTSMYCVCIDMLFIIYVYVCL